MSEDDLTTLLGRDLSSSESSGFEMYLEIAKARLESLLCMSLDEVEESAVPTPRTFSPREGYKTLYVDPFISFTTVVVDDTTDEDVTKLQFEHLTGEWYNVIRFEDRMGSDEDIVVTAIWGLPELPATLKLLLARALQISWLVVGKLIKGGRICISDTKALIRFTLYLGSLPTTNHHKRSGE